MKTYTIHITKVDIDTGKRYNSTECPIAQSLKRRKIPFVSVDLSSITNRKWEYIELPNNAVEFINDFDKGLEPKPISFEITI